MVTYHNSPSDSSSPLIRCFVAKFSIGELLRRIELGLDNANLAPRVRQDTGTRHVRIDITNGVSLDIDAISSFSAELTVSAAQRDHKAFGHVLMVVRSAGKLREVRVLGGVSRPRASVARPQVNPYAVALARLGLDSTGVDSLVRFIDAIDASGIAIITQKARQGAADCVYRRPARLAAIMVDIILRTASRTQGCCDQELYRTLPGFRLNLSDSQRGQFRADYLAMHGTCLYLGQLHVTLGVGHSPARCASVHWDIEGVSGPVVFTRIGTHGRNAHS